MGAAEARITREHEAGRTPDDDAPLEAGQAGEGWGPEPGMTTTRRASIWSPDAVVTPVTCPSDWRIAVTSWPCSMITPRFRAASA